MIQKVTKIAKNPLKAAQEEEQNEYDKQVWLQKKDKKGKKVEMETDFLEKTIIKIGALLALGFGEAGSEIIALNMSSGDGEVNPMIPGQKTMAIFGFCDIRNFTDTTEVLQEQVMIFVNEIADIVHSMVDLFSGSINKNIGDAFLLCWKFGEDMIQEVNEIGEMSLKKSWQVQQLADMSIISFIKIIAKINKCGKLQKYQNHPGLKQRLPGYKVQMGFGMHAGWSIEGAIGSDFKIDASYLSPNVNIAARLEAATKQFGVPLLISGILADLCSKELVQSLRQIDKVTVKGSVQPLVLFTFDVKTDNLVPEINEKDNFSHNQRKRRKLIQKAERDAMRLKAMDQSQNKPIWELINRDIDIKVMRTEISKQFQAKFEEGYKNYISGNWLKSKKLFEEVLNIEKNDGPTKTLLEFIKQFSFNAPLRWPGYRELTEK